MDVISGFFGLIVALAKGLNVAFGKSVTDYPLVTIVVLLVVYIYLHKNDYLVLIDFPRIKFLPPASTESWIALIVGFIAVVIIANAIGWIFNGIFVIVEKTFSSAVFLASPFDKSPLEFSLSFLVFSTLVFLYLWFRAGWRINQISVLQLAVAGFVVLFCSYISTSLVASLADSRGGFPAAEAPEKDADSNTESSQTSTAGGQTK